MTNDRVEAVYIPLFFIPLERSFYMANIFADGEELLNKKDFDKQINTDLPLFYQVSADKPNLQSYFSSNGGTANGIQLIYKHYSDYSTILGLAAGASRTAIEIPSPVP